MSERALGVVPVDGRGSLPYALVHGESLVAAASWALSTAEVDLFDYTVPFATLQETGRALVLHDPLCPLTPAAFVAEAVEDCARTGAVVVGVRPVTDTVKEYADAGAAGGAGDVEAGPARVGATVDRDGLVCVTSPIVLPAAVVAALETVDADDFAALVAELSQRFPVRHLPAPPLGRRIADEADLDLLVALSRAAG